MLTKSSAAHKTHQEELIEQLLTENTTIKVGFDNLKSQYVLLSKKYQALCEQVPRQVIEQIDAQFSPMQPEQTATTSPRYGRNWDDQMDKINLESQMADDREISQKQDKQEKQGQDAMQETFIECRNSQKRKSRSISISQKSFPLIQGCFILQRKPIEGKAKNNINEMIEFSYPEDLVKQEKQAVDLMLKYLFQDQEYLKVEDDQFNSRRNEILFGTPYEDFSFGFEDNRWNNKKQIPEVLKQMGTMKKKYYHILVRPEILQKEEVEGVQRPLNSHEGVQRPLNSHEGVQRPLNSHIKDLVGEKENKRIKEEDQKMGTELVEYGDREGEGEEQIPYFYETAVVYCIISAFPLRIFFQDLHRIIQQELKFKLFNNEETTLSVMPRREKYKIIGEIMENLFEERFQIGGFPIFHNFQTGVTKLELSIPSIEGYRHLEDEYLRQVLPKYGQAKICKLLHYVLAERFIMVEASTRRQLNEIFEIVRILIRPFLWLFANVYVYSEYFGPFLSSPMPILVGRLSHRSSEESSDSQEEVNEDHADFLIVKMNETGDDLKDSSQPFFKSIKRLKKNLQKREDKIQLFHQYINHLKSFIEKGVLDVEPTDFHMEFIDTQMVSYYKESSGLP